MSNTKLPAPFGYFCEWKAPVGYPPSQTLYYGEPGNGVDDDWNRHPEIHKNLPLFTAEQMHDYATADRERQAGEAVTGRAAFEAWFTRGGDYEPDWLTTSGANPDLYLSHETENLWQAFQAGAASLPAPQAVQAGWKLVPVEPTEDMLRAGRLWDNLNEGLNRNLDHARVSYAAMLTAAPSPDGKAGPGFPLSLMGRAKAVGDEAARLAQRLASKTSHFEEQPDGTVTPVDPADRGFKAEQAEAPQPLRPYGENPDDDIWAGDDMMGASS